MSKFIPRGKMSKKARRELDLSQRTLWTVPPATRKIENKKRDERKRKSCCRYDEDGAGFLVSLQNRKKTCFFSEKAYTYIHQIGNNITQPADEHFGSFFPKKNKNPLHFK